MDTRELEVASFIALWLDIHGGDPPETSAELGAIVGQIIANLATVAFGLGDEVSVDAIKTRLSTLNVQVKKGQTGGAGGGGITSDARIINQGGDTYIEWPGVPGGPPIIVKVPRATLA